jgi:flagellar hook-associated protein 2
MPTITAGGIATGLDVNSIISQLMALERKPLDALEAKQKAVEAQISAFGTLKSALSTFSSAMAGLRDVGKFQPYAGSSSNETAVGVSLGAGAGPGTFAVTVTQLASNHKLASGPYAAGAEVGTGTLNFTVGTETFSVTIDATNSTLTGIRDAINAASGNSKVSASIINGADGARLILTSRESGAAGSTQVAVTGDGDGNDADAAGLSALAFVSGGTQSLSQITAAQDAALTIDGFAVTSASNDVTTAVDGVTFNLKALGASTVTINRDDTAITTAAQDFAKAYNDLKDAIAKLRSGNLASDSSLRSIESSLSTVLQTSASVGGSFSYLTEIGISRDRYGKMQVDTGRLTTALGTDPAEVIALFTHATEGIPARMRDVAESLTRSDGLIAGREEGLNSRVRSLEDQQLRYERRLELVEQRLRAQFTALDNLVSQMQSTGTFLTQQLSLQQNANNQ